MQLKTTAPGVSLSAMFPEASVFGGGDVIAASCSGDYQSCRPGDVFIAFDDGEFDGHESAREAVERGASAILAERPLAVGVPTFVVEDTREAYSRLCHAIAGEPSQKIRVVGVSGTAGKSTTATLISSVLDAGGFAAPTAGTTGYSGHSRQDASTPAPPEMATWLADVAASGCSHAVVELSSRALAQRRAAGMTLDAAVLTNVRRDHLDLHGSVANYRHAKMRLFDLLADHGFAVVNADDPSSERMLSKLDCPAITYGVRRPAELTAEVIERHRSEQTFLLTAGRETIPVCTKIIGDQHVYNCLAAASLGLVSGLELAEVVRGLEAVEKMEGRLERIECGQPYSVLIDCAHTPEALAGSLRAARSSVSGRVICVVSPPEFGASDDRPLLGRIAERESHKTIITSDAGGDARDLRPIHDVLDGFDRPEQALNSPNRRRAIETALSQARPGDAVIICGKQNESSAMPFADHDRETAEAWLYKSARDPVVADRHAGYRIGMSMN